MPRLKHYLIYLFVSLPILCLASSLVVERIIELLPGQDTYQITSSQTIKNSEIVQADSLTLLPGLDYTLEHLTGVLKLLIVPQTEFIFVRLLLVPPELADTWFLYQERSPSDSLVSTLKPRQRSFLPDDGKLLISGSKTFALTFSEDSSFDLKQSLYINLDGELGNNVNIMAQLSDSQSKLTPEGDSKELSSLDKVFIRIYGRQYEIAMGDLEWQFQGTRYIDHQLKIEGLNVWYRDKHFTQAGFTAAAGKSANQQIVIIEGKQGPYYLRPSTFQSSFQIVAGSEQIYLDGGLLERGRDYYIDYSDGTVMFRQLVVSTNRVDASYQYSDEYYRQSTLFNSSRFELAPGLAITHHLIHQSDDKNNPLLFDFTPSDIDSLVQAGDSTVWGNGVTEVDPGAGTYIRKFTDDGLPYYEYAPSDTTAMYLVIFSYVGPGFGDYEEYSSGKFRYLGPHQGSWLPQKRLIPPVRSTNADLSLTWQVGDLELALEGILTANDKNTFSHVSDNDNLAGIINARAAFNRGITGQEDYIRLDGERRWAGTYLFGQDESALQEFDFATLPRADSLAQTRFDLTFGTRRWLWWQPDLLIRYRDVPGSFTQRSLRLISQSAGSGWLPAFGIRSAVSSQTYADSLTSRTLMQFHELTSRWDFPLLKARLALNYNSLEPQQTTLLNPGSRYLRFNPQVSVGNAANTLSQISVVLDRSDRKTMTWETTGSTQTYALKHSTATLNHTVNLDYTHREIQSNNDTPRSNFDLINLRNSHYLFKQALMLQGTYQLNQTEFFPKIRELQYIGTGLGLYDSTGVYAPDGDYDFVYITSEQGTPSAEVNAQLGIYLKPGNAFTSLKRIHSDISVRATEQTQAQSPWRSYLFLPGAVFSDSTTIFGKQNYTQTVWLDIIPNRLTGSFDLEWERSLDNRYQGQSRTNLARQSAALDLKKFLDNNYSLKYQHEDEQDSRYMSDIEEHALALLVQRNLTPTNILTLNLKTAHERGQSDNLSDTYTLTGLGLEPGFRGAWGVKGRLAVNLGARFNQRTGSDFMSFLPEKRAGLLLNWSMSAVYRFNAFSSGSIEYTGNSYPGDRVRHNLKLEFKAEL